MQATTEGIVLRATQLSGSRNILSVFTKDHGLTSLAIRSSGKANARNRIFKAPLTIAEFTFEGHGKKNIYNVKEARLSVPYNGLINNFHKRSVATFLNEIIVKSIKEEEPNVAKYEFLKDALIELDCTPHPEYFHVWFMVWFSKHLGFFPRYFGESFFDLQEGVGTEAEPLHAHFMEGDKLLWLSELINSNEYELLDTSMSIGGFLNDLIMYYKLHVENFGDAKTVDVLTSIYNDLN